MEELMVVANVAIIFGVIYKLFELFACRRERMMLIEKLSSEDLTSGKKLNVKLPASFSPLRLGCLLLGLGLGLLVGYSLVLVSQPEYFTEEVFAYGKGNRIDYLCGQCIAGRRTRIGGCFPDRGEVCWQS